MKKIYILFIVLTAFLVTGCQNDPVIYSGPDFVSFDKGSVSKAIKEDEDGIIEIVLSVSQASDKDRTFNIAIDAANTTAVEGQDYDFITAKNVTIPAGKYTGSVKVKGVYDNLTPEGVKLVLKLDADASMLREGTTTNITVNISRFFEVTMDWLEGSWLAQDTKGGENFDEAYNMTIQQINGDTIAIGGLFGIPSSLIKGVVDYSNAQIQVKMGQYIFTHSTLGPTYIFNVIDGSLVNAPIIFDINFRGITTGSYGILNATYSGWFPLITIMTKEE